MANMPHANIRTVVPKNIPYANIPKLNGIAHSYSWVDKYPDVCPMVTKKYFESYQEVEGFNSSLLANHFTNSQPPKLKRPPTG